MTDKLDKKDTRTPHQALIGLGGEGFRAICSCGWRSAASWAREDVATARDDHKRRALQEDLP